MEGLLRGVPVVETTLIAGAYWVIGSECEISRPDACWQRIHSGYADRVSRPNDSTSYQATIPTRVAGIRSRLGKAQVAFLAVKQFEIGARLSFPA